MNVEYWMFNIEFWMIKDEEMEIIINFVYWIFECNLNYKILNEIVEWSEVII